MTPFPAPADDHTEEEAVLWAARLDGGTLSAAERVTLDAWLDAEPARRTLLSAYCQFSADLEQRLPLLEGIREWSVESRTAVTTARPTPWLRWPMLAGVTLSAAAAVAIVLWIIRAPRQMEDLFTPMARRGIQTLVDGTKVELNAQTSMRISLDGEVRHVQLASGEAFFSVAKDAARPFIVETPAGTIRVTGTRFEVRSESAGALEVVVEEGVVQVRPGTVRNEPPYTLHAGDRLTSGPEGVRVGQLGKAELADTLAWRQGQIVFAGVPLQEALMRFGHYHGRGFVATPAAAELRVGGRYSLDDIEGFFTALEEVLPVHVTHDPSGTVQVGLRSER